MFVRQKNNKSGLISVQVIDKSSGRYKMIKTIGSSLDPDRVKQLVEQGKKWILAYQGQLSLDLDEDKALAHRVLDQVQGISIAGTELLLGKIFDEIGFGQITDPLFKKLVLARLSYPASKLKTTDYLYKYHQLHIDVQSIYRYLDRLYNTHKELVQHISYEHTVKVLRGKVQVVFYDVTTIYFEIDKEDNLRKTGYSKDGKHQHPQILLGLLVAQQGYPLAYEIFQGNKFEGHTMLPVIKAFKSKYNLEQLIIVADAGLMSNDNIKELIKGKYEFILGARIKKEADHIKDHIWSLALKDGQSKIIKKDAPMRLVINYSEKRAKKDRFNRERGLKKLEKQINSGKLTKSNINNRGYNKYLRMDGRVNISIDYKKFEADAKWDGLKGYVTNTSLSKQKIIENYGHLWKIEKAFRIAKSDLKIRPIYHRAQRRIEAHICLNFVAYKIYKELERQLRNKKSRLSPQQAIEIAKTIYSITVSSPNTNELISRTLLLNEEQRNLAQLFNL